MEAIPGGRGTGRGAAGHLVKLVLGTRGSALALAQVQLTIAALQRLGEPLEIETRIILTGGDEGNRRPAVTDAKAGVKGLFTKEIEEALRRGEIDVAVHSGKDLPGTMSADLEIAGTLERASTEDVLITRDAVSFKVLPAGAMLATGSVRRARQLLATRSDLRVVEIRGNVPTRLRKLQGSADLAGLVLARAGLDRLGYVDATTDGRFDFEGFPLHVQSLRAHLLPAIGQGAIALQIRRDRGDLAALLQRISHQPTLQCLRAERALLALLDGDCDLPVGAETWIDGDRLTMRAIVFDEGQTPRTVEADGAVADPEALADRVFRLLYAPPFKK